MNARLEHKTYYFANFCLCDFYVMSCFYHVCMEPSCGHYVKISVCVSICDVTSKFYIVYEVTEVDEIDEANISAAAGK